MTDKTILKIEGLSKYYPGVKAIDHLSMEFREGEVHALLGENGAGKSTLIKCIAGAIHPDEGIIEISGEKFTSLTPQQAKEKGVQVIYQEFNLVPQMSCAENVYLNERTSGLIVNTKERSQKAKKIFEDLGVDVDPDREVGSYTPAYMQIVEIAKAVSRNVRILIMDEPTAPLTVNEVGLLFRIVKQLKEQGVTIIYISHRIEELFEIGDRVSVMRDGQYVKTLNIGETNRKELVDLMVGRELTESYPSRKVDLGEEVLRVEKFTGNGVEDINFTLHKGEILGFGGLVGAGRTELMNVIYGANKLESGQLYLEGKPVRIKDTADALARGIGMIPEDRKRTGVFLRMSIRWNTVISAIKRISRFGIVNRKKEQEIADYYIERLRIRTPSPDQLAGNLSGGNQQKVVLAKTMAANTRVIIFDEPTRGVDVGAKQEIYQLMNQLVEEGHSILMVSSDMPELLGMSDRIVVICEGRQAGIVPKEEFSQAHILDLASGTN
ncbi:sugar ABC transporter ATP-binding protein [Anaerofilum sp. BX8]|uniref:Sugar ABC transporter ATP-binding protein n=1 Tax=Anaerofilum hominis TaxID=2763016 RepID=A0A923IAH8_9FIRM|nr:sugar ABC transporter ATP-binding protein [Anaerofilum hominis]